LVVDAALTPVSVLDDTLTFKAVVDDDFDSNSDPWIRASNADINVNGDWDESTGAVGANEAAGRFSIRLNADTAAYETGIGTSRIKEGTRFGFYAYDGATLIFGVDFAFSCKNVMDPVGTGALSASSQFYDGVFALGNGVSSGTVSGISLGFTPTKVEIGGVSKPLSTDLNLWAWYTEGSATVTGFDFTLNGATDKVGYKLYYRLIA
jgi:hypothetical protein